MTERTKIPAAQLRDGGRMPMVGFGTWRLRGRACRQGVTSALAAGYRHIDTATMYANESEIGQALEESGRDRQEVFIATKIRPSDADRPESVLSSSLRALGTEYADLWLIHWPPHDSTTGRRLWRDMLALRDKGRTRAVGVSNYSLAQIDELIEATGEAPAVNQIHWNPSRYNAAVLAGHTERGVVVEGYSPLKDTDLASPVLTEIATAHRVTAAQVVLRWHLEHDIAVIPKSAQPDRIAANIDLFGFALTAEQTARIDALSLR